MKKLLFTGIVASAVLTGCSTVSTIMQNTFPLATNFVVTQGSPANTQLSAVGAGTNINQLVGATANVRDIRVSNATLSVNSGSQGMGVFKSVRVYLSSGGSEVMVASRENIADNIGSSLSLDVNNNQVLDNVMKSGGGVQQRIVYVLKSTPSTDMTVRSSINFSSVPATNQ